MTKAEVGEVSCLLQRCYAWLGEHERLLPGQTNFLQSVRGGEETILRESAEQTYLVASDDSGLVGLVAVSGNEITKLYVHSAHHGSGIGRALYEAAERTIRSANHVRVALGAFPTAVPFYEAMGLRTVGERECAGALTGVRITLMEKQLESGRPNNRLQRRVRRRR